MANISFDVIVPISDAIFGFKSLLYWHIRATLKNVVNEYKCGIYEDSRMCLTPLTPFLAKVGQTLGFRSLTYNNTLLFDS